MRSPHFEHCKQDSFKPWVTLSLSDPIRLNYWPYSIELLTLFDWTIDPFESLSFNQINSKTSKFGFKYIVWSSVKPQDEIFGFDDAWQSYILYWIHSFYGSWVSGKICRRNSFTDLVSLSFRCSNTFAKVEVIADVIWKTQRYHLVRDYASHPVLPPPLIVVEHAFLLIRAIIHKLQSQKKNAKQSGRSRNRTFSEFI